MDQGLVGHVQGGSAEEPAPAASKSRRSPTFTNLSPGPRDRVLSYPTAQIGIAGAEVTFAILHGKEHQTHEDAGTFRAESLEAIRSIPSDAYAAQEAGLVDRVIAPRHTRQEPLKALEEVGDRPARARHPRRHPNLQVQEVQMEPAALFAKIKDILVDVLMLEDPTVVVPDAHIVKDLGAESINIAEITIALENEFDLVLPDESLQQVSTVQALTEFVARQLKEQNVDV